MILGERMTHIKAATPASGSDATTDILPSLYQRAIEQILAEGRYQVDPRTAEIRSVKGGRATIDPPPYGNGGIPIAHLKTDGGIVRAIPLALLVARVVFGEQIYRDHARISYSDGNHKNCTQGNLVLVFPNQANVAIQGSSEQLKPLGLSLDQVARALRIDRGLLENLPNERLQELLIEALGSSHSASMVFAERLRKPFEGELLVRYRYRTLAYTREEALDKIRRIGLPGKGEWESLEHSLDVKEVEAGEEAP